MKREIGDYIEDIVDAINKTADFIKRKQIRFKLATKGHIL